MGIFIYLQHHSEGTAGSNRLGKNACTSHKIEARDLYNLVLTDIQEVAAMALKAKEAFYSRLSQRMEKQYLADTDSLKKEYESLTGRNGKGTRK